MSQRSLRCIAPEFLKIIEKNLQKNKNTCFFVQAMWFRILKFSKLFQLVLPLNIFSNFYFFTMCSTKFWPWSSINTWENVSFVYMKFTHWNSKFSSNICSKLFSVPSIYIVPQFQLSKMYIVLCTKNRI